MGIKKKKNYKRTAPCWQLFQHNAFAFPAMHLKSTVLNFLSAGAKDAYHFTNCMHKSDICTYIKPEFRRIHGQPQVFKSCENAQNSGPSALAC